MRRFKFNFGTVYIRLESCRHSAKFGEKLILWQHNCLKMAAGKNPTSKLALKSFALLKRTCLQKSSSPLLEIFYCLNCRAWLLANKLAKNKVQLNWYKYLLNVF